ncbi:MAG: 1-acyl-sn-glycerol-3-phosphate acyltransferase [Firmicutes bacterium]|uniref:1-acyl-sn-glycerol-3-phosphate acyltransferase n=1 Tax=Candidatus Gallilactobacillus intestinavium TaxID=2840838 RepID=A0A9D9H5B5_9LACO|nr:1-acyl-sn-glycerol-3-phosphate acyltransferase [Candidatus Gallilactobacillus intestinavium]
MFYRFARFIIKYFVYLINGKPKYLNKQNLPKESYILVGPHRTWFDPIFFALAASPKEFSFMAKQELFKNPLIRFILNHVHAYPVNRQNPGPSAIKTPVKILKEGKLSTIIFPSGTRYSKKLKAGALIIAKMANVPLIPTVYQGPLSFKKLFTRQQTTVNFGKPIYLNKDSDNEQILNTLNEQFKKLDLEIDPSFKD